jgi:hypothetical protein
LSGTLEINFDNVNRVESFKRVKIAMKNTQETKSAKKKQSFPPVDIGTPKVPVRKTKAKNQQSESLSDWEHAS